MTTPKLFEPLKMGDVELKNRIVLAPMTRGRAGAERIPNELMAEYYFQIRTPFGNKKYETPRALTVDEIKATVNDYGSAAANAKEAGFSGIEVHSANG